MGQKVRINMALDSDLLAWVEEMVQKKRFASRTHAVEYALQRLKEQEVEELHISIRSET
jgi:Arc/MetJ-type ribon-helix-helix transcriptional regulator